MPSVLFPTPWKVILKAIELAEDGTLWEQASASLARIAAGFAGGSLIGQAFDGTVTPLVMGFGGFGCLALLSTEWAEARRSRV